MRYIYFLEEIEKGWNILEERLNNKFDIKVVGKNENYFKIYGV